MDFMLQILELNAKVQEDVQGKVKWDLVKI